MKSHAEANGSGQEASLVKQSLAALRGLQSELDAERRRQSEPIAILGMGCRYPGADSPEALWELVMSGKDAICDVPADRWDVDALYDADLSRPGKLPSRRGGFLRNLDRMDAAFFGISPREAPHVDPRQRLMLEVAWEALEEAAIPPDSLAHSKTGVFVATLTDDYDHLLFNDLRRAEIYSGAGTANSVVANRLSYFFNLHGPSISLDTACSGSLVAIHLACESLRSGESTLALAGGVSVNLMAKSNVFFARSGALSPSGLCRTFDAGADGIVRSDGVGVVVLKRLSEALRDGDRVQAVIRATAVNHDGRSNGIMAPNGEAQRAVLEEAYRRAGVSAAAVQYVELHGTGTPLGDPIEAQALVDVLGVGRNADQACLVGSLKSNVGHTEAAAGVGGVIKTVLAMRRGVIPPTANFQSLNPMIPFAGTPFRVVQTVEAWPVGDASKNAPYLAGVSGFGFGGTNAHLVLEGVAVAEESPVSKNRPAYLFPVSAGSPRALAELAESCAGHLLNSDESIAELCSTAARGRAHLSCRKAVVGTTKQEIAAVLRTIGSEPACAQNVPGKLAFVFSGQGSHWPGMGRQLYTLEPVFRAVMDRCETLLREQCGWSLLEALQDLQNNDTEIVQPAIFAIQAALCDLWRWWGVVPDYVVGHSLGEAAAAYCASVLTLEDALRVVVLRSRLMKRTAGKGKTAVVGMTLQDAREAILGVAMTELSVAGSNSPAMSVLSGTPEAVDELLKEISRRQIFCREIAGVDIAFHSTQMDPLQQELTQLLSGLRPARATIPIVSTVSGEVMVGENFDAAYWGRNLREPFLFTQATEELLRLGCETFIEVSPHAVLSSSLLQTAKASGAASVTALPSLRKGRENELLGLYETLASLYAQGRNVHWQAVYPERGRAAQLPHYPWQRERYWLDQLDTRLYGEREEKGNQDEGFPAEHAGTHPLLGRREDAARTSSTGTSVTLWQSWFSDHSPPYFADHRVHGEAIAPGAAWLEMAREAGTQIFGGVVELRAISFDSPLRLSHEVNEVQTVLTRQGTQGSLELFSRTEEGKWVRHVHATALPGSQIGVGGEKYSLPAMERIARIRSRSARAVSANQHYAAMQVRGLNYGPAFRLLTEMVGGNSEAVGEIQLPMGLATADYGLHPAMLDAALQLAAVAQGENRYSYLPVAVGSYTAWSRVDQALDCSVELRGAAGDIRLEADLHLCDKTGRLVAQLKGLVLQRVDSRRTGALDWKSALIGESWIQQGRSQPMLSTAGKWLLFAGSGELVDPLQMQLDKLGQSATVVRAGSVYGRVNGSRIAISRDWPHDIARLLHAEKWTGVVLLPGAGDDQHSSDVDRTDQDGLAGCGLALAVVQALLMTGSGTLLRLITRGGQAVREGSVNPWQAPLAGLALTIALEHPELQICLIDLQPEGAVNEAEEVAREILTVGDEVRVAFRSNLRFVSRIESIPLQPGARKSLSDDAAYLITGGLGSLGMKTAERLVRDGARHLVLTSRSAAESPVVEALRSMGATVTVTACDLARSEDVDRLFNETLRPLPPLRGVIHAAGVVDDAMIPKQTAESFRRVMAAKVYGAWNLHRRTRALPLDFFVLYSSAASLLGSAGQSNYAAANSFLDQLAHHRRTLGLAGVSINWGAWSGPGMAARTDVLDRLKAQGVATIPSEDGLDIVAAVIAAPQTPAQLGVFPVDWKIFVGQMPERLRPRVSIIFSPAVDGKKERISDQLAGASHSEVQRILFGHVHRLLAQVLGYKDEAELNPRPQFFELGMDSLTAVEFRNRLQEQLRVSLPSTLAFDYPEIGTLVQFLATLVDLRSTATDESGGDFSEAQSAYVDRAVLDGMSSDDISQLLAEELAEEAGHGR